MAKKFYSAKEAQTKLGVDRGKFYRLVGSGHIKQTPKPGSKQSVYAVKDIDVLAQELEQYRAGINDTEELVFQQATPEDMDGVFQVAASLFGHTSSVEQRRPMVEKEPRGNYIVKFNDEIVAFVIIQPLVSSRLDAFMKGEIRGWDLTANDLDCFHPGGSFDCLVKSIGSTKKYGDAEQIRFARRLLSGTVRELIKMGRAGIKINKLYATSPYEQGQKICESAEMIDFSEPIGDRRTFVVDISQADGKPYKAYRLALAGWMAGE